ncbi:hypothetical protein G5C51_29095 [Streptomyces sp. A7024]|uniref:Uncharacterized protein n=1 Tax=Streptomyces coryli TaxID=1128680 RepID=A0A6G4U7G8_9ACTN|nr:hypothetical protein [Streptomyces coryli]NGN67942.1 hypothetical protein [Streptomyces coryli]
MRSKLIKSAGALIAVLAVAAGWFFGSGTYDRWQDARGVEAACDGAVDPGEARALLGDEHLKARTRHGTPIGSKTKRWTCWIDVDDGYHKRTVINLEWRSRAWAPHIEADRDTDNYQAWGSSPIGSGWSGMLNHHLDGDRDEGHAIVTLACRNKPDSLTLYATNWTDRSYREPSHRANLARLATGTAHRAAEKWGCDAKPGKPVRSVPPLFDWQDARRKDTVAPAAATGTCRGVPGSRTYPRMLETTATAPGSPIEDCFLVPASGRPDEGLRLSSFYGTFADDQRRLTSTGREYESTDPLQTSFEARAEATCPGRPSTAVYTLSRLLDTTAKPPRAFLRDALTAFAERSAKLHGCTDVRLR